MRKLYILLLGLIFCFGNAWGMDIQALTQKIGTYDSQAILETAETQLLKLIKDNPILLCNALNKLSPSELSKKTEPLPTTPGEKTYTLPQTETEKTEAIKKIIKKFLEVISKHEIQGCFAPIKTGWLWGTAYYPNILNNLLKEYSPEKIDTIIDVINDVINSLLSFKDEAFVLNALAELEGKITEKPDFFKKDIFLPGSMIEQIKEYMALQKRINEYPTKDFDSLLEQAQKDVNWIKEHKAIIFMNDFVDKGLSKLFDLGKYKIAYLEECQKVIHSLDLFASTLYEEIPQKIGKMGTVLQNILEQIEKSAETQRLKEAKEKEAAALALRELAIKIQKKPLPPKPLLQKNLTTLKEKLTSLKGSLGTLNTKLATLSGKIKK